MLEIRNLERSFRNKQVLFELDLTAQQGVYPVSWEKWCRENNYFPGMLALLDYGGGVSDW